MVQTIPAIMVALYDLERRFQLTEVPDLSFFEEWHVDFPDLTSVEKQRLDRVYTSVANLER